MGYSDDKSPAKGVVKFAGCLVLAFLALPFLLINLTFPGPYTSTYPRPFDSEGWKNADIWSDTRCGMVADLQFRIGVEGKARQEIEALLGPDEGESSNQSLSYWHLCPSFLDIWILEVRWQDDRVAEAWIRDT
ncbi:MAG: hypothetical protein ACMUJI_07710 [Erythrobacter sp.]|uniref:hypothetical protein n=1 Tax=Erythrobacter sp. TaxID=1042 RepID=UPI003A8C09B0